MNQRKKHSSENRLSSKTKRLISILLTLLIFSCGYVRLDAKAGQTRTYNFSREYSYSSDPGQYMVNIARAQYQKTGSSLGYSEDWCADFVADCAELAGQSAAIPKSDGYAWVPSLDDIIVDNAGGWYVYEKDYGYYDNPKPGDIVFVNWSYGSSPGHVEIATSYSGSYLYTIGGNRGSTGSLYSNYVNTQTFSSYDGRIVSIIRPNYNGSGSAPSSGDWDFNKPSTYLSYPGLIKKGSSGTSVTFVQTALNWLGYDCGYNDGQFGSNTESAVKSFQSDKGLEVDGIVGSETWNKLVSFIGISDIGTDFYAFIIQKSSWKHIENTGSNVQIAINGNDSNDPKQIWHFERTNDGTYKITNSFDGKCLDLYNADATNGSNIGTYLDNSTNAQRWVIFYNNNGESYGLRNTCGYTVLDCVDGNTAPGTNIQIWEYNDTIAQQFVVYPLSNDGVTYSRPAVPDASTLSVSTSGSTSNNAVFSWTASSLKSDRYDNRMYRLRIWKGSSAGDFGAEDILIDNLTETYYMSTLESGTYTANLSAINTKYYQYSSVSNSVTFTVSTECIHLWDSGVVTKRATCSSTGVKTLTCSICGATKTETLPRDSSNHTGGTEIKNYKAATCGLNGYTGDTYCKGCGAFLSAGTVIGSTGRHTWNGGAVTKAATCSETGVKTFTCTVCGAKKTETISILQHTDADGDGLCDYGCGTQIFVTPGSEGGSGSGSGGSAQNVCRYCGQVHTGVFGGIIAFFHNIMYFFKNLFG